MCSHLATADSDFDSCFIEAYSYDALDHLVDADRNGVDLQSWNLDELGNWTSTTSDIGTQTRGHNAANELLGTSGTNWMGVVHDLAGNMSYCPKPGAETSTLLNLVYDGWNRLVQVRVGANVVGSYEYDAAGRRIEKTSGGNTLHYFWNEDYQNIETRKNDSINPLEQWVFDIRYVDAPVVRFSSPPSWVKPYAVLSNGEKFRCDLARALVSEGDLVAFDEFSSLVDRTVAKIGSAAVAKSIRSGRINKRFVAVTCHYDIVKWLEPDWVLDMATGTLARGSLQCRRPEIRLEIVRCERTAWKLFAKHHYMSASLHPAAQCYLATWNGEPVGFVAMMANFGHKDFWRISRIVALPDYQGLGIGTKLAEAVAQVYRDMGKRVTILASHPAVLRHCEKSPLWRLTGVYKSGKSAHTMKNKDRNRSASTGRAVASFEFLGARQASPAHARSGCGIAGRG